MLFFALRQAVFSSELVSDLLVASVSALDAKVFATTNRAVDRVADLLLGHARNIKPLPPLPIGPLPTRFVTMLS